MKQNKKQIGYSFLVLFIPAFIGMMIASQLPEQIAVHFNFSGVADGFANKWMVIFGMPCLMAVLHMIVLFAIFNDPKKNNIGTKMTNIVFWMIPVFSIGIMSALYAIAVGWNINILSITGMIVGFVFMILGNYMGKNRQNYTVGIRTPWTLNSHENWNSNHRLAGKVWVLIGLIVVGSSFIEGMVSYVIIGAIAGSFIPVVYSFYLFKVKNI